MALFNQRIATLEVFAEGLKDEEGNPIESLEVGKEMVVKAGNTTLLLKVSKDGKYLEIEATRRAAGYSSKTEPAFRMSL